MANTACTLIVVRASPAHCARAILMWPTLSGTPCGVLTLRAWITGNADMFFSFSSRRRHTSCLSDWSSDVCSSDWSAPLIYELVWFQLLQLVVGSSAISLGVLLGTFMGGMCLGSLALAFFVPARQHPLRVYACLELGIGLIGLLALVGMPLISNIYTSWAGSGVAGITFRGVIAGICLLPPTL